MRHKLMQIIDGKRYNTETATVIASDVYGDHRNFRNVHLYRSPRGNYFLGYSTCWQGGRSRIDALTVAEAKTMYEALPEHEVAYEEAFPGSLIPDA